MADSGDSPDPPPEYPRQELLPQQVESGPSRKPLAIAVVAVLVLVLCGVGAYLLLRDDGEQSRSAYCEKLRALTKDGDLSAAVDAFGPDGAGDVQQLIDDAPDAVADDWEKLRAVFESQGSGDVDPGSIGDLLEAAQAIASDAQDECDLTIDLPNLSGL